MSIITEEMVMNAVRLARPSALAILKEEGTTWGPRMVAGEVTAPGIEKFIFSFHAEDENEEWDSSWGEPEGFFTVASKKMDIVMREKASTSDVVAARPWCIQKGEFLYPGGVFQDGISVTVSGAKGRADEAIAKIVVANIIMLAHLEAENRIGKGEMEI